MSRMPRSDTLRYDGRDLSLHYRSAPPASNSSKLVRASFGPLHKIILRKLRRYFLCFLPLLSLPRADSTGAERGNYSKRCYLRCKYNDEKAKLPETRRNLSNKQTSFLPRSLPPSPYSFNSISISPYASLCRIPLKTPFIPKLKV